MARESQRDLVEGYLKYRGVPYEVKKGGKHHKVVFHTNGKRITYACSTGKLRNGRARANTLADLEKYLGPAPKPQPKRGNAMQQLATSPKVATQAKVAKPGTQAPKTRPEDLVYKFKIGVQAKHYLSITMPRSMVEQLPLKLARPRLINGKLALDLDNQVGNAPNVSGTTATWKFHDTSVPFKYPPGPINARTIPALTARLVDAKTLVTDEQLSTVFPGVGQPSRPTQPATPQPAQTKTPQTSQSQRVQGAIKSFNFSKDLEADGRAVLELLNTWCKAVRDAGHDVDIYDDDKGVVHARIAYKATMEL